MNSNQKNQFTVDLGNLALEDKERDKINAAIHKAVAGELAALGKSNSVALFPVSGFESKLPDGRSILINGIIIRDFEIGELQNIFDSTSIKLGRK